MNWRFFSVVLVPGLCVGLFFVGKAGFEAWVLGVCDSKLGCSDGVAFAAWISVVAFVLTVLGCGITAFIARSTLSRLSVPAVGVSVVIISVLLCILFRSVPNWPYSGLGLMVAWALLSLGLSWATIFVVEYAWSRTQ